MVNYLALMLINLSAGLAMAAYYAWRSGVTQPSPTSEVGTGVEEGASWRGGWAVAAAAIGGVQLATGLHMVFNWPLATQANIAFGESSVLFGAVLLAAALVVLYRFDPVPVSYFALFAGIYAITVGTRIINQGFTKSPLGSGAGFILAGLAGVLAPFLVRYARNGLIRWLETALLLVAMAIFLFTGVNAIWGHMGDYAKNPPWNVRIAPPK